MDAEAAYLRARSGAAALRFLNSMRLLTKNLSIFPLLGHLNEEFDLPDTRRIVVGEYLVDYELSKDEALVLAIRHGRQRPTDQPFDTDDDYELP